MTLHPPKKKKILASCPTTSVRRRPRIACGGVECRRPIKKMVKTSGIFLRVVATVDLLSSPGGVYILFTVPVLKTRLVSRFYFNKNNKVLRDTSCGSGVKVFSFRPTFRVRNWRVGFWTDYRNRAPSESEFPRFRRSIPSIVITETAETARQTVVFELDFGGKKGLSTGDARLIRLLVEEYD